MTPSVRLRHQAISASAGTGKTYALAHRYIGLLHAGVPPDRICALTFSRKAAGEIFDEIVRHLCEGARNESKARQSSQAIDAIPGLKPADFQSVLRQLVDRLHRLHIGTIDSFIVGVVRAFPFELGLSPGFTIGNQDGAIGDETRRAICTRLFDPSCTSEAVRRDFLEAFKLATFGQEHKSLGQTLETFLADLGDVHRRIPSPQAWGQADPIWGSPLPPWSRLAPDARQALAAPFIDRTAASLPDRAADQCAQIAQFLRDHDDRREGSAGIEKLTLFPRLWQVVSEPMGQSFAFPFNRASCTLPAPTADALRRLVGHVMAVELDRGLRQTRGIERVLALYETLLAEHVRHGGQLGFDDLSTLVAGGGLTSSRVAGETNRLFIDYRLDAVLNHWLLDEFQDTSDLQWRVLSNLIDETIQDDSGTRSFFCVGDVKQAIYGWRGGNHKLFGQIQDRYGEALEKLYRDQSFRSAPVVIEAINRIFDPLSEDDGIPTKTLADWRQIWRPHHAAHPEMPGCVEGIEAVPAEDERDEDARYRAIAERLTQIDPIRRGIESVVLLRTNHQARRCADVLRQRLGPTPVALEGAASLLDNPLVPLLLSLVRFAAHPGDTFAWRHLQMSPLGKEIGRPQSGDASDLRSPLVLELLAQIQTDGFQPTLRAWSERLAARQPFDAFTRLRRDHLLDAAATFDASGDRDCDRFVRFVEGYTRHDTAGGRTVRVMTIHQSKGLGFDAVFVPFDPKGESFDNPDAPEMLEEEQGAWVLKMPRKGIVETDAVLRLAAERQRNDAVFAKLCVFYVALTRAKQGLYWIVSPPPKQSAVVREDTLLRKRFAAEGAEGSAPGTLRSIHLAGDPAWHTTRHPDMSVQEKPSPPAHAPRLEPGAPRLKRIEPSKQETGLLPAANCFAREGGDVRLFGSAIHRLFQQIEWLDTFDIEQTVAAWRAASSEPSTILRDVERQFRASLATRDVRETLSRPSTPFVLWREKPFELLHDGALLAGQFDRVVIEQDPTGRPTRATLLDFKSNRVENEAALPFVASRYQEQMGLYALALRQILGPIPIHTHLVFTRIGRVYALGMR